MKTTDRYCTALNLIFKNGYIVIACFFMLSLNGAHGQDQLDFGKFYGDVRAPSAPAFTILGTNPSDISRPKSYRDVEFSLLNNFLDQGGLTLPQNFAVEFSPYWMFEQPDLTFKELYRPSVLQSALYNLSFSLATQTNEVQNVSTTFLGLGLRTVFDFGRPRKSLQLTIEIGKMKSNMAYITIANTTIRQFIANSVNYFDGSKSTLERLENELENYVNNAALPAADKDFLKSLVVVYLIKVESAKAKNKADLNSQLNLLLTSDQVQSFLDEAKKSGKAVQSAIEDRVGFKLEVAMGLKRDYLDGQTSGSKTSNAGFWLTPSYIHENLPIEFLGVFRYTHDNQDFVENGSTIDWTRNVDFGLKLVYKVKKFSLEGEFIYREQTQVLESIVDLNGFSFRPKRTTDDRKIDFTIAYQVNENVSLSYTYGQNFELPILDGDLISGLNLNIGLGGYKMKNK